jgi:hypothetical protein
LEKALLVTGLITVLVVYICFFGGATPVPETVDHAFGVGFHLGIPDGYCGRVHEWRWLNANVYT